MQRAQQTYGNRAVQRYLQRCAACSGQEETDVQRQAAGEQSQPVVAGGDQAGIEGIYPL